MTCRTERTDPQGEVGEEELFRGLFIVIEGPDGAGKTTQVKRLVEDLGKDHEVVHCQVPGTTPMGKQLRVLFKTEPDRATHTEVFMALAAIADVVDKVIVPALSEGKIVVCDRYLYSTIAYQGYGSGVPIIQIESAGAIATRMLTPTKAIFLDVPPGTVSLRRGRAEPDVIEVRDLDYQRKVCGGYTTYAAKLKKIGEEFNLPPQVEVLSGLDSIDVVYSKIREIIDPVIEDWKVRNSKEKAHG